MKNEEILRGYSCFIKDHNNEIVEMPCVNIDEHFGNNNIVANMELSIKGIFLLKGAVIKVVKMLKVWEATVYRYLSKIK